MSDAVLVALITIGIPAIGYSLKWFYERAREAGRADEYKVTAEAAILAKNKELDEARALIATLQGHAIREEAP